MNPQHDPEALLDAVIEGVRNDSPDAGTVEQAGRRAWARIAAEAQTVQPESISGCDDFRALFPQYLAGTLSPARHMLVEDHIHTCVACRKALHPVTARLSPAKVVEMPRPALRPMVWAKAAAVIIGVSTLSWYAFDKWGPAPGGTRISVVASNGPLYKVSGGRIEAVAQTASFGDYERLRTPSGSTAMVRLPDGSTVEVAERAEFSVSATRRDTTVHLDRGQIIVQAAKRDKGHLYVTSADSRVAVTGTVFSVNRGLKGSRVSVIEGSVEVSWRGDRERLAPGDQVTTDTSMSKVPVSEEISWSRNIDQHIALMQQAMGLKEKLDKVQIATLRYGSRLLDAVPEGTTMYVTVPNLGRAIADVERIVKEQAGQSPALRAWLATQLPQFEKVTQQLTQLGEYLGDEIVLSFQQCQGFCGVLVADVNRPGLREYLDKQNIGIRVSDGTQMQRGLNVVIAGNRVYLGEHPELIRSAMAGNGKFAQSGFGQTVAGAYKRGAGILVAADLETMMKGEGRSAGMFGTLGIERVRHLVAEQREVNGKTQYSAVVSFDGMRRGVAAWLAEPGTMGSLAFVSPNAQFATSFVVKEPAQMLTDALALSQSLSKSRVSMNEFERATGVRMDELAHALGGEVTFAFDGPMIPTPAWKVVFEVRDSAKVQDAITKMIAAANTKLKQEGATAVEAQKSMLPVVNVEAHMVKLSGQVVAEVHYAFVDGYLLLTSSQGLLDRAIRDARSGVTLARSRDFRRLLPRNEQAHFSGMVYQNAGELLKLAAQGAAEAAGASAESQGKVKEITDKMEPMLLAIYGEQDKIELASQGSALNLITQSLAGSVLGQGAQSNGTRGGRRSYR